MIPGWVENTIEATGFDVGDANDFKKNISQKQCGSVDLMTHVLEARDPDTFADAHGLSKWENAIT